MERIEQWFTQAIDFLHLWHPFANSIYALPGEYMELAGLQGASNFRSSNSQSLRIEPVKIENFVNEDGITEVRKEIYHFRPLDYPNCGPTLIKSAFEKGYNNVRMFIDNYFLNYWDDFLELITLFQDVFEEAIKYYDGRLVYGADCAEEETCDVWENHSDMGDHIASLMSNFKDVWAKWWDMIRKGESDIEVPKVPSNYFPRFRYKWDERGGYYELLIFSDAREENDEDSEENPQESGVADHNDSPRKGIEATDWIIGYKKPEVKKNIDLDEWDFFSD